MHIFLAVLNENIIKMVLTKKDLQIENMQKQKRHFPLQWLQLLNQSFRQRTLNMADLLFVWFGFDQTMNFVSNSI